MNHQITIITIKDAIRIFELDVGMDLYSEHKNNIKELNYQVVLDELENLSGVGSARLLHYELHPKNWTQLEVWYE